MRVERTGARSWRACECATLFGILVEVVVVVVVAAVMGVAVGSIRETVLGLQAGWRDGPGR